MHPFNLLLAVLVFATPSAISHLQTARLVSVKGPLIEQRGYHAYLPTGELVQLKSYTPAVQGVIRGSRPQPR